MAKNWKDIKHKASAEQRKVTHFVPWDAAPPMQPRAFTLCGRYIDRDDSDPNPTCPVCRAEKADMEMTEV